jgi:hypothetical protein
MRNGSHRFWLCIAAALAVIAVPAASAGVGNHKTGEIGSRVTLPPPQKHPFYGQVKSSRHACEVHRLVKVFRVPRAPGRDHYATRIESTTNQRGNWRNRQLILAEGDYYAKVVRSTEGTAGTTFVCGGDHSPTTHVQHQG